MYYFTLYSNGMEELLQENRDVYATFNSLYLVSSNILLTHTHTHTHTHTGAPPLNSYTNILMYACEELVQSPTDTGFHKETLCLILLSS